MNDLDLLKRDLFSETQRCAELFNSQIFTEHQIFGTGNQILTCKSSLALH